MRIEAYERQPTWKLAMKLVATMYRLTQAFPQAEKAGLTVAVRRIVTAIPAKLADAHGHRDDDEAPHNNSDNPAVAKPRRGFLVLSANRLSFPEFEFSPTNL
jgi:hypothetical protein